MGVKSIAVKEILGRIFGSKKKPEYQETLEKPECQEIFEINDCQAILVNDVIKIAPLEAESNGRVELSFSAPTTIEFIRQSAVSHRPPSGFKKDPEKIGKLMMTLREGERVEIKEGDRISTLEVLEVLNPESLNILLRLQSASEFNVKPFFKEVKPKIRPFLVKSGGRQRVLLSQSEKQAVSFARGHMELAFDRDFLVRELNFEEAFLYVYRAYKRGLRFSDYFTRYFGLNAMHDYDNLEEAGAPGDYDQVIGKSEKK